MSFLVDKQTLADLNILGRFNHNSIVRLFDKTVTRGGSKLLEQMFHAPLSDADEINTRSSIIRYFRGQQFFFPFTREEFDVMVEYLGGSQGMDLPVVVKDTVSKKMLQFLAQEPGYGYLKTGVNTTIGLLFRFFKFVKILEAGGVPLDEEFCAIRKLFEQDSVTWLNKIDPEGNVALFKLIKMDYLLRGKLREQIQIVLEFIYKLDVYIAVADVAKTMGYSFAKAMSASENLLIINNFYHPRVEKPVNNSVIMDQQTNMIFLTGANMAGKSTLMKSIGVAVYLAHMGFPVAADEMIFSVKDGLITSINVADSLESGYSHFFAEVQRVKKVAEQLAAKMNIVTIFDELFKGTNVKDAYDATLSIIEALSVVKNSLFIVSTHLTEVGETLKDRFANVRFAYLPTVMEGSRPRYTYLLREGVTDDRHGMIIIRNERILELLRRE